MGTRNFTANCGAASFTVHLQTVKQLSGGSGLIEWLLSPRFLALGSMLQEHVERLCCFCFVRVCSLILESMLPVLVCTSATCTVHVGGGLLKIPKQEEEEEEEHRTN